MGETLNRKSSDEQIHTNQDIAGEALRFFIYYYQHIWRWQTFCCCHSHNQYALETEIGIHSAQRTHMANKQTTDSATPIRVLCAQIHSHHASHMHMK